MFKQNIKIIIFFAVLFVLWFSVFLFLRKVWFYRDPQREPEKTEKAIISPADGKVIYIRRIENGMVVSEKKGEKILIDEITKESTYIDNGWLIGIYMSPLDVHYNYSPISGKIKRIVSTKAKLNLPMVDLWEYINLVYLRRAVNLFEKKFHLVNERNTIFLENSELKIVLVEIADKFVNKINCFIEENDEVRIGQKISFIERGSQVDIVIFKEDIEFKVDFGQQVYGGKTVLAEY